MESITASEVELRAELYQPRVEGRRRALPRRSGRAVVVVGPERVAAVQRVVDVEVQLQLAAALADDLARPEIELVDAIVEVLRQRLQQVDLHCLDAARQVAAERWRDLRVARGVDGAVVRTGNALVDRRGLETPRQRNRSVDLHEVLVRIA